MVMQILLIKLIFQPAVNAHFRIGSQRHAGESLFLEYPNASAGSVLSARLKAPVCAG
jgi:hypothetical protein